MDIFYFAELAKLKYVHHTIDKYSRFQWATALTSEKADLVITHLLDGMAIMGIPVQIKSYFQDYIALLILSPSSIVNISDLLIILN